MQGNKPFLESSLLLMKLSLSPIPQWIASCCCGWGKWRELRDQMKGLFFVLVWFVSLSPQTISWHCKSDYSCLSKSTLLQHHSIFSSFLRIKYSSSHLQKKTVPRAHLISAVFFFFRLTQTTQPGWKCAKCFLAAKTDMRSLRKSQRQSTPSQMFFLYLRMLFFANIWSRWSRFYAFPSQTDPFRF